MKKFAVILLSAALFVACNTKPSLEPLVINVEPTDNVLRFKVNTSRDASVEVRKKDSGEWVRMPGGMAVLLYPETEYECRAVAGDVLSNTVSFTTGTIPEEVPTYDLTVNNGGPTSGYLMQWKENDPGYITIADVYGNVVWYHRFEVGIRCADYDIATHRICAITGAKQIEPDMMTPRPATTVNVVDLFGNEILNIETSAQTVEYPHHEAKWTPDGNNMLFVSHNCHTMDLTSLGLGSDVKVWGDEIIETDIYGKPVWRWDVLDHLNVLEAADYLPMNKTYDLIHMNCASKDSEGNYYTSLLWIKELWKIDGKTGEVLYRIGPHGDVNVEGGYAVGGFHSIVVLEPDKFIVNNNSETMSTPTYAKIYEVDPVSKTAKVTMNVPLDAEYTSTTGGNAQVLSDGKTVMFDSGQGKCCAFVDMEGNILRIIKRQNTSYRAFYFERMF